MPARTSLLAYAALGALVIFAGLRWLHRDAASERPAARVSPVAAPAIERAPQPRAVVHVAGAVRRPGVYSFSTGARVRDALRRAGGAAHGADPNAINLAAKLSDGQQVVIPRRAPPAQSAGVGAAAGADAAAGTQPATGPVSLSTATIEQLDSLDGVGPVTARKILERRQQGGLSSVDDLAQVPGIGPKRLESLRRQLAP